MKPHYFGGTVPNFRDKKISVIINEYALLAGRVYDVIFPLFFLFFKRRLVAFKGGFVCLSVCLSVLKRNFKKF